ncbi:sorbitol-6-phosphate 2-dehydrogenase [bacterium B17]|nr:sorbitol-6-phosphate 2-dehydrogenase [bacterium B17]
MSWLEIEGKVVIVTGAAAGIGRACAEGLAEAGANVVIGDINEEGGNEAVAEITDKFGGDHLFSSLNVTDKSSVDAMMVAVMDKYGKVDALVNNAGILIPRLLVDPAGQEEITEDILDKMLAINLKGSFLCAQAAVREMLKQGSGVVINMSSESGLEGSQGQSVYACTKAAQYSMTRSWAKELGTQGVRVVGIAPGILEATALRTPEYERAVAYTRGITVEEFRAAYEKVSIPLGRTGKVKEVADLVCFVVSDRSAYVHGTTLNITGGKSRG